MKSGPFIKIVSKSYGIEEKTVSLVARFLKNAGLFSMAGRGINAPHVTPLDAARLTIALLATDRPARAVELTRIFCDLTVNHDFTEGEPPEYSSDPNYCEALEDLLCDYFKGASRITFDLEELEICEQTQEAILRLRPIKNSNQKRMLVCNGTRQQVENLIDNTNYYGRRTKRSVCRNSSSAVLIALMQDRNI